jgi:hypothetical protein
MFHARICTTHDAFHLIAEVNPYNLQTLRHHVRQSIREDGPLKISLQVDASDQSRPILHRLGFEVLSTTTPYDHS